MGARLIALPNRLIALRVAIAPSAREAATAALLAAAASALLLTSMPPVGDAPAHLYRELLVREGVTFWDNLWYGGHYPLASYSLLAYLPAALVGSLPLVVVSVILSAALFAWVVVDEWGEQVRWAARVFGVLAAGSIYTGTYSYALGLAALLATIRALQDGRTALAVIAAAVTAGVSPLAFVFLSLLLGGIWLAQRRVTPRALTMGAAIAALAALQLAVLVVFPSGGVYPFRTLELVSGLTVCLLGAALALRTPRAAPLTGLFVLWMAAALVAFVVSSPVGENLTRLRALILPLILLVALLARFRPRWLALPAVAVAAACNLATYVGAAVDRTDVRGAQAAFWTPAIEFLQRRSGPQYRVEVVPTFDHWEAYWLPRAGIPIARGWYRQLDLARNPVLYERGLDAPAYRSWLRRNGVRFVVLPHTRLGEKVERHEAELLQSGRSGLVQVFASREAAIYELPEPVPILSGRGTVITLFAHSRIEGRAARGVHTLRVAYMPYWQVGAGDICLEPGPDGTTRLRVRRAGPFALVAPETPTAIARAVLGGSPSRCRTLPPA